MFDYVVPSCSQLEAKIYQICFSVQSWKYWFWNMLALLGSPVVQGGSNIAVVMWILRKNIQPFLICVLIITPRDLVRSCRIFGMTSANWAGDFRVIRNHDSHVNFTEIIFTFLSTVCLLGTLQRFGRGHLQANFWRRLGPIYIRYRQLNIYHRFQPVFWTWHWSNNTIALKKRSHNKILTGCIFPGMYRVRGVGPAHCIWQQTLWQLHMNRLRMDDTLPFSYRRCLVRYVPLRIIDPNNATAEINERQSNRPTHSLHVFVTLFSANEDQEQRILYGE